MTASQAQVKALQSRWQLIAIGTSLGGMQALNTVLSVLPADFGIPIAVVQHRYRHSGELLPAIFGKNARLRVCDAEDRMPVIPGRVYIAPADYHLLVERGQFHVSVEPPVAYSRPSIDVLFESAADAYGDGGIAVVLTGSNSDGAHGVVRVKQRGGFVVVQDPATAEAPEMPRAAMDTGRADRVLPLDRIGTYLIDLCRTTAACP